MALRIRKNGDILCAAHTIEESGDTYINDNLHYILSDLTEAIRPSKNHRKDNLWFWNVKDDMIEHYADLYFNENVVIPNIDKYSISDSKINNSLKTKLIQTKDYLLLIDEESRGIEFGEIGVNMRHSKLEVETRNMGGYGSDKYYWSHKKCLAYYPLTKEAKELELPLLPNPFEEEIDIEKLIQIIADENKTNRDGVRGTHPIRGL